VHEERKGKKKPLPPEIFTEARTVDVPDGNMYSIGTGPCLDEKLKLNFFHSLHHINFCTHA
jgi:hypothetical protein